MWGRGVDVNGFSPDHFSEKMRSYLTNGNPDAPLVVFVGRLAVEKRIETLRPLLNSIPSLRLAIVGDGPIRKELEKLFSDTNTIFTGYLRDKVLSSAYATADAFVFPSANETFGNVVLEAMASGLPVVVPNSGGVLEHVVGFQNGLVYDTIHTKDLIQKVKF